MVHITGLILHFNLKRRKMMKMKKYLWIGVMMAITIFAGQTIALADGDTGQAAAPVSADSKPTAELDMGVFSQYIWRGFEESHNSVVIQPSVTLGYEGFSFNIWGNMDTDQKLPGGIDNGAKYTETDYTLSYTKAIGITKLTGGYIYYALDAPQDSQEIFASVSLDTFLSPTLSIYREIAYEPAWYVNLGVSYSQPIVNKVTLDLAASAGYYYSDASGFADVDNPSNEYRALHNGLVSAGFTIPFNDYISVKPMIAYSFPLSGEASDYIKANSISDNSSFFYGGATLSFAY